MAAGRKPKRPQRVNNPFNEIFDRPSTAGKYPGKGMYRGPVLNAIPEFNFDAAIDEIGEVLWKEVQGLGVSENVKKLIWDDVMNAMVVSISPKPQSYNLQGQPELRGDEAEIAGFNPSIDINPVKWIMDPEKMAAKTAEKWVQAFWNTSDMTAAVEANFYNRLLEGDKRAKDTTLAEPWYDMWMNVSGSKKNFDEPGGTASGKHGFQLSGFDVVKELPTYKIFDPTTGDLVFIDKASGDKVLERDKDRYINEGYAYYKEGDKSPNNQWVTADEKKQMIASGVDARNFTDANPGLFGHHTKEIDAAGDTKDKFRNYVRFSKAEGTRRTNYTDFGISAIETINLETKKFREKQFKELGDVTTALKTATGDDADLLRNKQKKLLNDIEQADTFMAEAKVIGTLKDIQGRTGNTGLKGVANKMNQARLGTIKPGDINSSLAEFFVDDTISVGKQEKYGDLLKTEPKRLKEGSKISGAERSLKEAEDLVLNGLTYNSAKGIWERSAGTGNSKEWNRINARLEPFRTKLRELRNIGTELQNDLITTDARGNLLVKDGETLAKGRASRYKGIIDDHKNLLSQNGMFSGYGDMIVEQTMENVMDRESQINALMAQHPESFQASTNVINVMREGKRIYIRESTRDFLTKLEKKGVVGVLAEYGWKRFRTMLNGYAPAAVVQQWLESRQYFGLTYNPDYGLGGSMSALANPTIRKIMDSKIFDNNVSINLAEIGIIGPGAGKVLKFKGHRRFGFGMELFKKLALEEDGDFGTNSLLKNDPLHGGKGFKNLVESKKLDTGKTFKVDQLSPQDFFHLLNGELDKLSPEALDLALLGSLRMPAGVDAESITSASRRRALKAMADNLREWLYENRVILGLEKFFTADRKLVYNPEGFTKLFKLFGKMTLMESNSDLISILNPKAGIIQKLVSFISKIQTKLFLIAGAVMAPYVYIKNSVSKWLSNQFMQSRWGKKTTEYVTAKLMQNKVFSEVYKVVSQRIASVLAKVFGYVITDVTMGFGLVAQWLVERVVQVVINKVIDAFKGSFDRLTKYFEFGGIDLYIEDAVNIWLKMLKGFTGCCSVGCAVPMVFMAAIIAMITPIDPSKSDSGLGYAGAPPGGPSQSCTPCCGPNTEVCPEGTAECTGAPGECEIVKSAGCFVFTDKETEWPRGGTEYEIVWDAAQNLLNNHGCYVDKVCANGPITVRWDPGRCGWTAGNTISFGDNRCWTYVKTKQNLFNNLFAHETGHVYDGMNAEAEACVQNAADNEGYMLTYPVDQGNCSATNVDEDFAETIAQFVWARPPCGYPNTACSGNSCPMHVSCAEEIFSCE